VPSVRHIGEIEFGLLLPTPNAFDYNTPRKEETFKKAQQRHASKGVNLQNPLKQMAAMGMLPTPMSADWKGGSTKRKKNSQLTETLGISSQLNPRFVAEMMGFPPNWTELPFQSGEQNL
jgi:hypothetical protein